MEITFNNGLKAYLNYNPKSKHPYTAQLYTAGDMFLVSAPCEEKDFEATAKGLMYGYFSGWKNCKDTIWSNVKLACNVEVPRY